MMAFEYLEDAEKELQRSPFEPELLIADLAGSKPASELNQLSAWTRRLPVWVLAAHGLGVEDQLEGRGFEAVIFRPFGIKELVDRIKHRLGAC